MRLSFRIICCLILAAAVIAIPGLAYGSGASGSWEPDAPAANQGDLPKIPDVYFRPQVEIPGPFGFSGTKKVDENLMADYFRAFYVYFISVVGILAVAMIVFGGFRWITAAGNSSKIQSAKDTITSALIGLALALTSNVILRTINPNLIKLRIPGLDEIQTRLQREYFCTPSGKNASDAAKGKPCGMPVPYTDADGRSKTCVSDFCATTGIREDGKSRDDTAEVCGYNRKENGYGCVSVKEYCNNEDYNDENDCPAADETIRKLPSPPVANTAGNLMVCRKDDGFGDDKCELKPGYQTLSGSECIGGAVRASSCREAGDKDTPCWRNGNYGAVWELRRDDPHGPAVYTPSSLQCSDSARPTLGRDALCCMYTSDVRCSSTPIQWNMTADPNTGFIEFPNERCAASGTTCNSGERCYIRMQIQGYRR